MKVGGGHCAGGESYFLGTRSLRFLHFVNSSDNVLLRIESENEGLKACATCNPPRASGSPLGGERIFSPRAAQVTYSQVAAAYDRQLQKDLRRLLAIRE